MNGRQSTKRPADGCSVLTEAESKITHIVDCLTERLRADGYEVISGPRTTGGRL